MSHTPDQFPVSCYGCLEYTLCPIHRAAPALLAALEGLLELEGRYTRVGLRQFDAARAALALVKKEE